MSAPTGTLDRRAAVKALLTKRGDLLVISGLGSSSYDVFDAGEHPGNFYLWGAMGGAAMVGLGLALAQPNRPVLVITGDGSGEVERALPPRDGPYLKNRFRGHLGFAVT
ncbi:thiamine pyrophosphate-dependent enzyme [Bradyrhizobium septentrionale]|uniref:Thiamine pyrophosphate enzyme TPP-binding domain-containing protein n=1 Tax=Bradyrhizobium septentrionale TaxID=1404411 RepID=A0A973VWJ3_9BRAD|nr:thiamine pyrophosphate-dependent enzyme [Bradyrhizobium septentrionale]UGY12129.1 thiamine pyrophosphate-dependent enzyme [Bradyrhizobium septentrionale]